VGRVTAAVAIGSNLGDRAGHLDFARARLQILLSDCRFSSVHETEPIGVLERQPLFLNAAAVGGTHLTPRELLAALLAIELARGRARPHVNAPRTLDLDLVLHGDAIINLPDLIVPHPRFRGRLFVLQPLAEIAPEMVDPMTKKNVGELLRTRERSLRPGV
jgi:2-amino-4-hydroxy-6-hydroxymethyldihydropteridine diphosphokinase